MQRSGDPPPQVRDQVGPTLLPGGPVARPIGQSSRAPQFSADAVAPSVQQSGGENETPPASLALVGRGPETLAGPVGLSGQLWTAEDQRLAEAAIARDHAKHWALSNPCVICGFPVGDHSEGHALSCYRMARMRSW